MAVLGPMAASSVEDMRPTQAVSMKDMSGSVMIPARAGMLKARTCFSVRALSRSSRTSSISWLSSAGAATAPTSWLSSASGRCTPPSVVAGAVKATFEMASATSLSSTSYDSITMSVASCASNPIFTSGISASLPSPLVSPALSSPDLWRSVYLACPCSKWETSSRTLPAPGPPTARSAAEEMSSASPLSKVVETSSPAPLPLPSSPWPSSSSISASKSAGGASFCCRRGSSSNSSSNSVSFSLSARRRRGASCCLGGSLGRLPWPWPSGLRRDALCTKAALALTDRDAMIPLIPFRSV
mmetsp:Transcript_30871/g.66287  ORF Transcript_30871/g.66287 Transcript_30871/m.66287 type:complete len:299 (-) Transcript_30871:387-1283(-)